MDWTGTQADITAALTEVGFPCTLRRIGAQDTPWAAAGASTDYPITAIEYPTTIRDGSGMETRTLRTLMIDSTVTPLKGDRVIIGAREERIGEVRPLRPGGVDLLYEVLLED